MTRSAEAVRAIKFISVIVDPRQPFLPAVRQSFEGASTGSSEIEIRPVFEAADFGEELTPELREQEDRLRQEVDGR